MGELADELQAKLDEADAASAPEEPMPQGAGLERVTQVTQEPEVTEEPAQDGRLRDPETGQFTTAEKLWGGRFQTPEELERHVFDDLNPKLGSMTNELGTLRQQAQELEQIKQYLAFQQQQAQAPGAYGEEQLNQFDEWSLEHPKEAADWSLQTGNQMLYERAIDNWYAEDPKNAGRYEATHAARAAVGHVYEQFGPALQPLQQQYQNQGLVNAYLQAAQAHPDLSQYSDQILQVAQAYPAVLDGLRSPDPAQKAASFEALYHIARSTSQAATATGQAPPAQAGQVPQQAGFAAHVASPSSIPAVSTSPQQEASQRWQDMLRKGLEDLGS